MAKMVTGSAQGRSSAHKRCAGYLALLTLVLALLSGCDTSAQNLTGAMKADAEARRVAAQAPLVRAEAERIAAQAVADTQAEQMRQLDEANRAYREAQDARVRDMQMSGVFVALLAFAGLVGVIVLAAVIGTRYAGLQPYQPAPQIVERIERQVIFINPADLPHRGDLLRWGDVWVPRAQLPAYIERATGSAVQVWQGE